jgi:hypothetical protein
MSRYLPIYKYHSKRAYKQFLEEKTIERANKLIEENFPKRIKKEVKIKLIDCVVIFLKYITVKYDYYPNDVIYTKEFEKIIAYNFAKILNN